MRGGVVWRELGRVMSGCDLFWVVDGWVLLEPRGWGVWAKAIRWTWHMGHGYGAQLPAAVSVGRKGFLPGCPA